jgi:hypothetical protein
MVSIDREDSRLNLSNVPSVYFLMLIYVYFSLSVFCSPFRFHLHSEAGDLRYSHNGQNISRRNLQMVSLIFSSLKEISVFG